MVSSACCRDLVIQPRAGCSASYSAILTRGMVGPGDPKSPAVLVLPNTRGLRKLGGEFQVEKTEAGGNSGIDV